VVFVDLLRAVAQAIATLVEAVGVAIVGVAVVLAAFRYVAGLLRHEHPFPPEELRLGLGRSLALSLEFLLGADILRTAVEPSWDEIGRLAAIATIRHFRAWASWLCVDIRPSGNRQFGTGLAGGCRWCPSLLAGHGAH